MLGQTDQYKNDIKLDPSIVLPQSASSLEWITNTNLPIFAGTFWDKSLRIFQVTQTPTGPGILQKIVTSLNTVPLATAWNGDFSALYIGCMDGSIKIMDINTQTISDIGRHNASVSKLHYVPQKNVLISSAYQNTINFWQGGPNPVCNIDVQNKVFITDYKNGILTGGTANQKIFFIDLSVIGNKTILDSIQLGKYSQIQSIALDNKAQTIGLATVDGRANISTISKAQQGFKMNNIITFKANKQDQNGSIVLYPVNSVSFNSVYDNWFMTAGSDGVISFWDYKARNKIKSFNYGFNPICCASTSANGVMLAYSNGNDWHLGTEGIGKWPNRIGVHLITQPETKFVGGIKK